MASLVDLFKGTIKSEADLVEVQIPERKIICPQCRKTYSSTHYKVKVYEHVVKDRVWCICPECTFRFSIKRKVTFSDEFLAEVAEKYRKIETEEEKAAREAKVLAKQEEKARRKLAREEENAYLKEEARREKEYKIAHMTPEEREKYLHKVEAMKKGRAKRRNKNADVDPDYI